MIRNGKLFFAGLMLLAMAGLGGCSNVAINSNTGVGGEPTGFLIKSLPSSGRKYGMFVPLAYSPRQKWPVIVFLHGIGEGGGDPSSCLRVGIGPTISEQQATFPFIVIFAQSHGSWDENSDAARDVIAALDQVERDYSVDSGCVTLTGLSTGGYATWAIGAKYKDRFSALVPMAAFSDHKDVDQLKDIPVWSFHNTGDPFVLAAGSHAMVNQINERGGHAEYTEFFAMGHDCWTHAYGEEKLFNWMRQQRRDSGTARRSVPSLPTVTAASAPPVRGPQVAPTAPPKAVATPARPMMVDPPVARVTNTPLAAPVSRGPVSSGSSEPPAMLTPW